MSPLAAPLASLLIFSGFALAQISAPDCSLSASWGWTYNSLNQNPCTISAYLQATCAGGTFTVSPLLPGYMYYGPQGLDDGDLCKCNTVTYSLLSACAACQGVAWIVWTEFAYNCTQTLPPQSFPNPIPSGTRVPQWALLDVTSGNNWNVNQSILVGDSPEIAPGALPGPSGVTVGATATRPQSTLTTIAASSTAVGDSPSSLSNPTPTGGSSSNTGAIVGGVVGGVVAISVAVVAIAFSMRRQDPQAPSAVPPGVGASQPPMVKFQRPLTDNGMHMASTLTKTPAVPVKLYDPSDPTTFPGYDGAPQSLDTPPGLVPSQNGTANTLAAMQTLRPQRYHGLPTV